MSPNLEVQSKNIAFKEGILNQEMPSLSVSLLEEHHLINDYLILLEALIIQKIIVRVGNIILIISNIALGNSLYF